MIDKQHLIDLKGVSKDFDGTRVLSNIDLYVRKKEFVTLAGPQRLRQDDHAAHHRRL